MLKNLAPAAVWRAFEEISRIPRGSGNTSRIADYIYNEAHSHGLNCHKDGMDNVVVWVPATEGRVEELPVILKARIDRTSIKAMGTEHEYEEDPIELVVEGDWLRANDTVLGAEDGIGVAMMMALFRDHQLSHPALELVFTTDDPINMARFGELDTSRLKGRRLISLDHEQDGILINGTAGVMHTQMTLPILRDALIQEEALHLRIHGFSGGHAAFEVDRDRDNPIQILSRLLTEVKDESFLVEMTCHQPSNFIPTEAEALISTETPIMTAEKIYALFEMIRQEKSIMASVQLDIEKKMIEDSCISSKSFEKIMSAMALMPVGVLTRDMVKGIATSSNNLFSIIIREDKMVIDGLARYDFKSLGENFMDILNYLAVLLGGEVKVIDNIPVWEPHHVDGLLEIRTEAYRMQTANNMEVSVSHGAVDSAVISKAEHMDTITIEPDIQAAHTVNEAVSIASVQRAYNLLESILTSVDTH